MGELAALRRADVDLAEGVMRVPRKLAALRNRMEFGPPKSEAGKRTVALPAAAVTALRPHMLQFVGADQEALVFVGENRGVLRSGNFRRAVKWAESVNKAGLPANFHFHDLRHVDNNLAAAAGASTRELMHRMGHASMRAALIYQHATSERDREIADGIDEGITKGPGQEGRPAKQGEEAPSQGTGSGRRCGRRPGSGELRPKAATGTLLARERHRDQIRIQRRAGKPALTCMWSARAAEGNRTLTVSLED